MLTRGDRTLDDAVGMCQSLSSVAGLERVGFKDVGLPPAGLADLVDAVHDLGCEAVLELVSLDRQAEQQWALRAADSGVELVLGGAHADAVSAVLAGSAVRYFPFAGHVAGHPSRLAGTLQQIVEHASSLSDLEHVHGVDLLAYRSDLDAPALARSVVDTVGLPVVAAGGIASETQIDRLTAAGVWGFTMGTAIFEGSYRPDAPSVCDRVSHALDAARRAGGAVRA